MGFSIFSTAPNVYRSTTRLLVESAQPTAFDSVNGEIYGGVRSVDVVRSEIYSDRVFKIAFQSPAMTPFQQSFGSLDGFISSATESLVVERRSELLEMQRQSALELTAIREIAGKTSRIAKLADENAQTISPQDMA